MTRKTSPRPQETHFPAWIRTIRNAAKGCCASDRFSISGLEIKLRAVDPALIRWVLKYLQPLSTESDGPQEESCSFFCLYDDDLVAETARYFDDDDNIDFVGRGKDGARLKCAILTDNLMLYCNGSDGLVWLADFEAKSMTMLFCSRTRRPALDFSRIVRDIITSYLMDQGWSLYHAGAVETSEGVLVIIGDPGAGKTTLVLALVRNGARYVANEQLFIRADGDGFEVLGYPMAIAIGLGTALQFPDLSALIEAPDPLLYPRRRFNLSRIKETSRDQWPSLDDKLQLLPEEIDRYVGRSGMIAGGRLRALVVPRISKQPIATKVEILDEDTCYDILDSNLLEPLHNRSRFAWSKMVTKGLRREGADADLLEKLCSIETVRFDYSLSASDNGSGFTDMLLKGLSPVS